MDEETAVVTTNQIHDIAEKLTPVKQIESSLAKFLNDTFQMAREEDDYQKLLKAEIINRLPTLKPNELIALMTSASTNKNDLLSKIMSPAMGLLTAAQQNELSMRQREQSPIYTQNNIKEINAATSADTLIGLQTLMHMINATVQKDKSTETFPAEISQDS